MEDEVEEAADVGDEDEEEDEVKHTLPLLRSPRSIIL